MVYPADEETFDERVSAEFVRDNHLNLIQAFLKRLQDFLGYGGLLNDKFGLVIPTGVMWEYPGLTAPAGYLLCNGKEYLRAGADYAALFAVIGTRYGTRHANYFNVPDRRGSFTRGYSKIPTVFFDPEKVDTGDDSIIFNDQEFYRSGFPVRFTTSDTLPAPLVINTTYFLEHSGGDNFRMCTSRINAIAGIHINLTTVGAGNSAVGSYLQDDGSSRLKLTIGGSDGEDLGSYQEDAFQGHWHQFQQFASNGGGGTTRRVINTKVAGTVDDLVKDAVTDSINGTPKTTKETRPRNVNVNYIIKR